MQTIRYGPYGENANAGSSLTSSTTNDPLSTKADTTSAEATPAKATYNDLYHYGERYYDPTTGRWTQQDPEDGLASTTQGIAFSSQATTRRTRLIQTGGKSLKKRESAAKEVGGAGRPEYEEGEYQPYAGDCDPLESPPGGVKTAE